MRARTHDILILGAGASGLRCGAALAALGLRAGIVDHAAEPARKVRISGGGKGNVTNLAVGWEDYWGENPRFCRSALGRLAPEALIRELEAAGIGLEERDHGQIFCRRSAGELVRKLADDAGACELLPACPIAGLERLPDGGFVLSCAKGTLTAPAVVVALGGPARPQIGASDLGLRLARRLGHRIVPPRPALAGIVLPAGSPLLGLQGISLNATIRRLPAKTGKGSPAKSLLPADNLSLLFTHKGFSGPAGLQTSLYLEPDDELSVDFLPETPLAPLLDAAGKATTTGLLRRLLPARLLAALLPAELAGRKPTELSRAARDCLCRTVHTHRLQSCGVEGMRKAEAARGGVDTREVAAADMHSSLVPGLFFCGEVLDVTGRLGGFNLHWAFASARAAALGAATYLERC